VHASEVFVSFILQAKYKVQTDPTVEDVKKLCLHCRKTAKSERVLFHYNGHGVPRPTANGEIWLFNKSFTQYIPLSVYELESWLGNPSIYVFDCSAAGMIVNAFCEVPVIILLFHVFQLVLNIKIPQK
jgi:regulator-associated protein of mTOR